MPCVTSGIQISDLIATHPKVLGGQNAFLIRSRIVFVHCILRVGNVLQMGKYVFLRRLPSPSHLSQSFCTLHDL